MNIQTNFSLVERAQGHGPWIERDELLDLLAELDAWRDTFAGARNTRQIECVDTPEELSAYIEELESNQENPDHADYDNLKEFFDDCVQALEDEGGHWPCAEAYDLNLRQVICDAIRNGAECEE